MSGTILGLLVIAFVLFVIVMIVLATRRSDNVCGYDEDEEVVTTTTTTTTVVDDHGHGGRVVNGYEVVGDLTRRFEGRQPYVIDPADNEKIWVNDGDDLYEDAQGRIWALR
ncbi:MAG TPA: hypothetical protein VFM18_17820 [Methanosarcina sp.]|nr:hypothetical protein [Methanosarcina sp.]